MRVTQRLRYSHTMTKTWYLLISRFHKHVGLLLLKSLYVLCATLCSQVKAYEKRMPPERDGKANIHMQFLQTKQWFKENVHHGNKQWKKAKPEEVQRKWFYMENDVEKDFVRMEDDDDDDDDDESEEAPPPLVRCKSPPSVFPL